MSRFKRNTVIQLALESGGYGVSPGSFAATDTILLAGDPTFNIDRDLVPRNLVRGFFGASESLIGTRRSEVELEVELAGSGTATTPPAFARLLRIAGMAETIGASFVEYTPVTTGQASATMRFFADGIRYTARGCRASFQLMMGAYGRPTLKFKITGFDTSAAAAAVPATDFTAWRRPLIVSDGNSGAISLGGSYNPTTGAITGGTPLVSRGLELDFGNSVQHIKLLGDERIDITDRETTGSTTVFLDATQEVTWRDEINANTLTSLAFVHGTTAGSRVRVFGPAVQRIDPQMEEYEGRIMMKTDLKFLPSATTGNDELRLVFA